MKVEKDNAMDRADACEEGCKQAKVRAEKAEEVAELLNKARQLETELDITSERLSIVTMQLEEKEKSLLAAEAEVNALNRRVQQLEEDLEKNEEKLVVAVSKLDKAATACDDSERMSKVLANKCEEDEKRMESLEEELKKARARLRMLIPSMKRLPRSLPSVRLTWKELRRE